MFDQILHKLDAPVLQTQLLLVLEVDLNVLAQISPAVHLYHQRVDNTGGDLHLRGALRLVGLFVILETGLITVEGRIAVLAIVDDVDIGLTEGAGHHDVGLPLIGEAQGGDQLEDLDQDVDLVGQDVEKAVQTVL